MNKSFYEFLIEEKVEIFFNPNRLPKQIEQDFDLNSFLILIVMSTVGSKSGEGKKINRQLLKLLLYIVSHPSDIEEVFNLGIQRQLKIYENLKGLDSFTRSWEVFQPTFNFLKVAGHVKEESQTVLTITFKGILLLERFKDRDLFQQQYDVLTRFKAMKFNLKDLGIT